MLALAELVSFFSECNMSRSTTTWEDASTTSASLVYYFFSDLVGLTLALVLVLIVKIIIRKIQRSNKKK